MRIMGILAVVVVFLISYMGFVFGGIAQPPILKDEPVAEQQYFKTLYDNHNVFDITTTAPNGNIKATKGKGIIYNDSGTLELWVNSDGSTTWQKI